MSTFCYCQRFIIQMVNSGKRLVDDTGGELFVDCTNRFKLTQIKQQYSRGRAVEINICKLLQSILFLKVFQFFLLITTPFIRQKLDLEIKGVTQVLQVQVGLQFQLYFN
eukprot:TRINITY_DN10903_c0_g2_i1.p2 TRINITY_DN10903_c0_g2~~TRINITY_DN10903_c0_g2_i1.p2  ORF type:complete len:109 (+),score=2.24 TRINITY_DN10903_c0_g2_i1:217-543(+)